MTWQRPTRPPDDNSPQQSPDAAHVTMLGGVESAGRSELAVGELLTRGESVGRYVVYSRLGAGGMGVVYAAFDPELERKVALKLFHLHGNNLDALSNLPSHFASSVFSTQSSQTLDRAQLLLLHEAKTAAKVNDPHVVSIFDAGVHEGRVFLAMEFVVGETLRSRLARALPPRSLALNWLEQCLHGLAAVHRAELVHADFKPDNAILGEDGQVKLLDFGLARASTLDQRLGYTDFFDEVQSSESNHTAGPVGTLSYLAPELVQGARVTVQSDLFAWGVTAYELLCGGRPFKADTLLRLRQVHNAPRWHESASFRRLPRWLRDVLASVLAIDPSKRPRNVNEVLSTFDRANHLPATRLRLMVSVLALGCATAAGVATVQGLQDQPLCEVPEAALTEVWHPGRAQNIATVFAATGSSLAGAVAIRLDEQLLGWQRSWRETYEDLCRPDAARPTANFVAYDRSIKCLREDLARVDRMAQTFEAADARVVERALSVIEGLEDPHRCERSDAGKDDLALPDEPQARAEVERLRQPLEEAWTWLQTGGEKRAERRLQELTAEVAQTGWVPLQARLRAMKARLSYQVWDYTGSYVAAQSVYLTQRALGAQSLMTDAFGNLISAASYAVPSRDELFELGRLFDAIATRQRDEVAELSRAYSIYGSTLINVGRNEEAERVLVFALELFERSGNTDLFLKANIEANLACARIENGWPAQGEVDSRSALQKLERILGPHHPGLGRALYNLAFALNRLGRFREAGEVSQRGRTIVEASEGRWAPRALPFYHYSLDAKVGLGQDQAALQEYPLVVPIFRNVFGPAHVRTLGMVVDWADAATASGDLEQAQRLLDDPSFAARSESGDIMLTPKLITARFALALAQGDLASAQHHVDQMIVPRELVDHASIAFLVSEFAMARLALALAQHDDIKLRSQLATVPPEHALVPIARPERGPYVLARAYLRVGDFTKANDVLSRVQSWIALAEAPHDNRWVDLWLVRAEEAEARGDHARAMTWLEQAARDATPQQTQRWHRLQASLASARPASSL